MNAANDKPANDKPANVLEGVCPEAAANTSLSRPLRIVMLDECVQVLEALTLLIQSRFKDASVLTFTDPEEALKELTRKEPDLFVTDPLVMDLAASRLAVVALLRTLAGRKVKYPIFVVSAFPEYFSPERLAKNYEIRDLPVALLGKPFDIPEFYDLMSEHLDLG